MLVLTKLQSAGVRRAAVLAAVVGLVVAGAVAATRGLIPGDAGTAVSPVPLGQPLDPQAAPTVLVFVSGAVARPGLYRLSSAARGTDAVAIAGGFTGDADLTRLPNLAARVHDGRQLNVPSRRAPGRSAAPVKADLNSASLEELRSLPGMPPGLAEAIVEYRAHWGPFAGVSELRTVLGVDPATTAALAKVLRVVAG